MQKFDTMDESTSHQEECILESPASEASISANPVWTISRYALLSVGRSKTMVNIEHPNEMGTTDETGLATEQARLARFRGRYVSSELHEAASGRKRGIAATLFRCFAGSAYLESCRSKTCFRREDLNIEPPPQQQPVHIDNGVRHAVLRSETACTAATELYGPEIMNGIELGFSRPFQLDELRANAGEELPLVEDSLSENSHNSFQRSDSTLSIVISYRHTTGKLGRMLNIPMEEWPGVVRIAISIAEEVGYSSVRFWTDQILSRRKPKETLRWVSSGVMPYAIYPVLFVRQKTTNLSEDLGRMWITVEHLMAAFAQGIIHTGSVLEGDELPHEWPMLSIGVGTSATWMIGLGHQAHASVRKLCAAIMCGLVRNKAMSWASDTQEILDWACTITSGLIFRDLAHSFDCIDCREPIGYTGGSRFMALLSSAVVISPRNPNLLLNESHPRLNVPAVQLVYNGKSWDGFREWIPESSLWGLEQDETASIRKKLMSSTRVLVSTMGGTRGIAVLQFTMSNSSDDEVIVAHLLAGLIDVERDGLVAKVLWSKRFWPAEPLRMWILFNRLWSGEVTETILDDFGVVVGAASMIDYRDLANATIVKGYSMNATRWR